MKKQKKLTSPEQQCGRLASTHLAITRYVVGGANGHYIRPTRFFCVPELCRKHVRWVAHLRPTGCDGKTVRESHR